MYKGIFNRWPNLSHWSVNPTFYIYYFNFTDQTAGNPTVGTLIFIAMLLTGFGVYDRIAQFAGAGSAVPVTGFGNAYNICGN